MTDENFASWIGKTEHLNDQAALAPLSLLSAVLDHEAAAPKVGDDVAPCWHWLYFLPFYRQSKIGPDGHPQRGGFLPPVPLPRRMWAGSRIKFNHPLKAGDPLSRTSCIANVVTKDGRSGPLVFVSVRHEISSPHGIAIAEEQDIVYRGMAAVGEAAPLPPQARTDEQFKRKIQPDPVLLFRYSALTFNGHRIHYDRPYATAEEGYAGLVVHGPLIATLLLDLLRREHAAVKVLSFEFKAVSPLLDTAEFEVCGRLDGETATLWARGSSGQLAMQASAQLLFT